MTSNVPNIYARIQQAYKTISATGFTKDGVVKGGASYKFISIGQILNAVRRAQAEAGITVIFGRPEYDHENYERRWEVTKESQNPYTGQVSKTTWYAAVGHIDVRLYGADADDCIELTIPFEAQDNSDKLTNKIITNAERTLYRTLYSIDEGSEDPEAFNVPMVPEPVKEVKADPFFGTGAPAKKAAPSEVTTDRPRETMVDTIVKASKDAMLRPVVKKAVQSVDADGIDTDQWTDDQVKQIYTAVVKAGRAAE